METTVDITVEESWEYMLGPRVVEFMGKRGYSTAIVAVVMEKLANNKSGWHLSQFKPENIQTMMHVKIKLIF